MWHGMGRYSQVNWQGGVVIDFSGFCYQAAWLDGIWQVVTVGKW